MTSNNHPNRNWRSRANSAADQWLETDEGRVLVEIPIAHGKIDGMRNRIRSAYLSGYADGRKSNDRK